MARTIAERAGVTWVSALGTLAVFSIFMTSLLVARHNVRKGRGDRRGALQLAAFVSLVAFGVWLLNAKHVADPNTEMGRFFGGQPPSSPSPRRAASATARPGSIWAC